MTICVWRYLDNDRNYPGYHLSADSEGCAYLKQRINDQWSYASIPLSAPSAAVLSVPNNQGGKARIKAAQKLKIELTTTEIGAVSIEEDGEAIVITFSKAGIREFVQGIEDIERGQGDYAMSAKGESSLWFW